MKTGYFRDYFGNPIANANYIRYIIDDEGKPLKDILDTLVYTSDIKRVSGVNNLPVTGSEDYLYIDTEDGGIYLWSNADSVYVRISAVDSGIIENTHMHANMETLNAIKYALTEELKNHYDSAIQDIYIGDEKQAKTGAEIHIPAITGAASSILKDDLDSNKVLVSSGDGKVHNSDISVDELNNLLGLTKNVENTLSSLDRSINDESQRAILAEQNLSLNLQAEVSRAESAEKKNADSITEEIIRATGKDSELQGYVDSHIASAAGEIQALQAADAELEQKKADLSYLDTELEKRYTKEQTYTKEEVLQQIENLIGSAPEVLDTFKEIADALGNDPDFAATMMTALSGKVDKETGKQLTSNDYSDEEKAIVSDTNVKKHIHSNKTILDKLTQAMLNNLASAFAHITDAVKHITADERSNWADAYNKRHEHGNKGILDKITQALLDKLNGIETGAEVNVQSDWNVTDVNSDEYIKGKPSAFPPTSHNHTKSQISDMPTKLSQFENDEDYLKSTDIDLSQSHTHTNKTILDKITQSLLDNWNAAFSHVSNKSNPHGVTVEQLGAASSSHSHTKSSITDFPTSLPANGGNAASATKLSTARTITFTGDVTGNFSFDGSQNVSAALSCTESPTIDKILSGIIVAPGNFTNLVAKVNHAFFTVNSVADVYFDEASIAIARKADIVVNSGNGYLELKAKKLPSGNLTLETIRIFDKSINNPLNGSRLLDGSMNLEGYSNEPVIHGIG